MNLEIIEAYFIQGSKIDINFGLYFIIGFIIYLLFILLSLIKSKVENTKLLDELNEANQKNIKLAYKLNNPVLINHELKIPEVKDIQELLFELIKHKFDYFLYKDILPVYNQNKIPEQKLAKKIKEDIYLSITAGLSPSHKKLIMKYFSKRGIEMIINERVVVLFNKVDYSFNKHKKTAGDIYTESSPLV